MNTIMKTISAGALCLALSIGQISRAEAVPTLGLGGTISFDADGGSPGATANVTAFNFKSGNLLAAGAITAYFDFVNFGNITPFYTIVQASMDSTLNSFMPVGVEITMVLRGMQMISPPVVVGTGTPPPITTTTVFSPSGINFLNLYYDTTPDASNATGTGFNDGQLILAASVMANCVDTNGATITTGSNITNNLTIGGALSGGSGIGTTPTYGLSGSADFCARTNYFDANFFPASPPIDVLFSTLLSAPFGVSNVASPMLDGTPSNIGATNGLSGPDILLESKSELTFAVPEPSTISLLALTLLCLLPTYPFHNKKGQTATFFQRMSFSQ